MKSSVYSIQYVECEKNDAFFKKRASHIMLRIVKQIIVTCVQQDLGLKFICINNKKCINGTRNKEEGPRKKNI